MSFCIRQKAICYRNDQSVNSPGGSPPTKTHMSGPHREIHMVDGSSPTWDHQGPHYPSEDAGTGSCTTSSVVNATGIQNEENDNNKEKKRTIDEVDTSSDEETQIDNWP